MSSTFRPPGERGNRQILAGLRANEGQDQPLLIPVLPGATVEQIIAQLDSAQGNAVELLVPNNTRALQSLAGCEMLRNAADGLGIRLTIFTADEQTLMAATATELDTVVVGSTVKGPAETPKARAPQPRVPAAPPRRVSPTVERIDDPLPSLRQPVTRVRPAPVPPTSRSQPGRVIPVTDDAQFLAGLAAFDRQEPAVEPPGTTVATEEGAVLFDAPGDLGVPRTSDPSQDAWAAAFDDMGTTMAAEPDPPPRSSARRTSSGSAASVGSSRAPKGSFLRSVSSAIPRRSAEAPPPDVAVASRTQRRAATPRAAGRQTRRLPLWPLMLLGLLALGSLAWLGWRTWGITSAGAAITLTPAAPPTEVQRFTGIPIPMQTTPVTDTASLEVQAVVIEQPVSVLVQGRAISETLTPAGRARGVLTLRNVHSQPITLAAGLVLTAPNGMQFTVDTTTTVPAASVTADSIIFGRENVSVTATTPGSAGNLPAGTITQIQSIGGNLRVEHGAFTGGSDLPVTVVRVEDVNRVVPGAVSQLYGTGLEALNNRIGSQPGVRLRQDTITPTLEMLQRLEGFDYGVFPPVGNVAPERRFSLELRATFRALAESERNPVADQLDRAVRNQLASTGRLTGDAEVQILNMAIVPEGLLVDAAVQPRGSVEPLPQELIAEAQQQVGGRPREEAIAYLQALVEQGRVAAFEPLPPEWTTVPEQVRIVEAPRD